MILILTSYTLNPITKVGPKSFWLVISLEYYSLRGGVNNCMYDTFGICLSLDIAGQVARNERRG